MKAFLSQVDVEFGENFVAKIEESEESANASS
jgi:hypothetical protein